MLCPVNWLCAHPPLLVLTCKPNHSQLLCIPNAHMCRQDCKHVLRHLRMVHALSRHKPKFVNFFNKHIGNCAHRIDRFFMFAKCGLIACVFPFFSILTGQCLSSVRWNYGSLCVRLAFKSVERRSPPSPHKCWMALYTHKNTPGIGTALTIITNFLTL